MRPYTLVATSAAALLAAACVERAPGSGSHRERVEPSVAERALAPGARPAIAIGAVFGGSIELVGADLAPAQLAPGATALLTLYWRALDEPETSWRVFVHLDAPGATRLQADHAPAGGTYPTTAWKRGDVVRDTVKITVPAGHPATLLTAWVGLYAGSERVAVTRPGALGGDAENRVIAARLPLR